jgi:hypothetical protein
MIIVEKIIWMGEFILKSGIIFLMLVCNSKAQIEEIYSGVTNDSTYRFQGIIPPVEFQYNINEIFNEPVIGQIPDEILFEDNPSTIWLRTELSLSNNNFLFGSKEVNTHFTSSLYQQYLKDSEFDMVRYILGTVQAGAVGYMAYRHIKKYGFWK